MLRWLRANWRIVLLLAAIWLAFECWISWAAFCDQPHYNAGNNHTHKEYSCVSRGPVLFAAQSFWGWGRHTFDDAESVIALFTGILAISTIFLWAVTKTAADAAKAAAEHIPTVERAWVFCLITSITTLGQPKFILHIKNHGKTPGFVKVVWAKVAKEEPFNPTPTYDGVQQTQIDWTLSEKEERQFEGEFPSEEGKFFYGYIRYKDIFGARQVSRFSVRLNDDGSTSMAGHPAWSEHYTEKES